MNIGGNIEFNFGKVKFVQAFHSNSFTEENGEIIYLGMPAGISRNRRWHNLSYR